MASNSFPPLLLLPLHIVGNILEHSDSIQQLGTTILSHRIFYNAFKEHPRYIAQSIIATQIPETTLPYALLSLESSRMAPGDRAAINGMLARFCPKSHDTGESGNSFTCFHHLSETLATPSLSLNTLSWSDYASLSRDYEVVLLLRQIMAEESVTMLNIFGIKHTASLTTAEKFRLNRSFYLFQTVCNMFCTSVWPEDWRLNFDNYMLRFDHTPEEYLGVLFHYFSPWVNHRLLCVYRFLERNIVRCEYTPEPSSVPPELTRPTSQPLITLLRTISDMLGGAPDMYTPTAASSGAMNWFVITFCPLAFCSFHATKANPATFYEMCSYSKICLI